MHPVQVAQVVVIEAAHLTQRQQAAVDYAGVIVLVGHDHIPAPDQARDHAQVDLKAGAKNQRRRLVHERRQSPLQFLVQSQGAVEEARTGAGGAVAPGGLDGRLAHARIGRQPEVVVGADHQNTPAPDHHLGALGVLQRQEVRVQPGCLRHACIHVLGALLKDVHGTPSDPRRRHASLT
jgi:hypothetical protein